MVGDGATNMTNANFASFDKALDRQTCQICVKVSISVFLGSFIFAVLIVSMIVPYFPCLCRARRSEAVLLNFFRLCVDNCGMDENTKVIIDAIEKRVLAMAIATVSYLRDEQYSGESLDRTKKIAENLNSYYVDALDVVKEEGMP